MPLFFACPTAAWLLPAIALPVVFHLFFRRRRQVREFPSLMFFMRIDPRLSAKRKIHEWLILLLRCLFLALLVLALMRPVVGIKGAGGNVARLILIDNSGSMAAPGAGGISKMELAARAAGTLVDSARAGDATAVQLMVRDPTSALPEKFGASGAVLRDALAKLTPSDGAAPVANAIRLALATLDGAKAPQHELHIVTDLEKKNWSRGEIGAEATNCRIIVHRVESAPVSGGSVALEATGMPSRGIPAGRITPVRFLLQNNGPAVAHVRVNSADDSGKSGARDVQVDANGALPLTLTFSFQNPGFHWAQVWLEGDAAPTATRAELGFYGTNVRQVMFAGPGSDFGAMPYAVAPGGNADLSGIDAVFAAGDLGTALGSKPLAVVVTWEGISNPNASSLQDYVPKGGTLFVLPSPGAGLSVARAAPEWIGAGPGALVKAAEPEPAVLLRDGDPVWQDLRDASGQPKLGSLRLFQYLPLKVGADWQTLIASANGSPLFARRTWEHGRIFAAGLAFTPKWSSLPLKAAFVALMQNVVFGGQAEKLPVQSIRAGEDFRFDSPSAPLGVRSLAGAALDWHGMARDFAGFPRCGVYEITQRNGVSWLTVSGNVDEADPHDLPLAPVPLLRNLPHDVLALARPEDILHAGAAARSGAPLYRWLLLLGLVVLLSETWLANERSSDLGRKLFAAMRPGSTKPDAPARNEAARV